MALVFADFVKETSTTTGTGTLDLGAISGFQTFVAGIGTTNTCYYAATDGTDWEVGLGTITDATPDTLTRTTVHSSSNADAAVNWAAGSKDVYCVNSTFNIDAILADIVALFASSALKAPIADPTFTGEIGIGGINVSETELGILEGLTATTVELNKMDGVTSTTGELNILDGVTASAAELNKMDGCTASTTELNKIDGVTATTTELNFIDGVTSALQTQLDSKATKTFRGCLLVGTASATDQSVTSGNNDRLAIWTTEIYDTDSISSTAYRLTVPTGVTKIRIDCVCEVSVGTGESGLLTIRKNNVAGSIAGLYLDDRTDAGNGSGVAQIHSAVMTVTSGDYFEVFGQALGGTVSFRSYSSSSYDGYFSMEILE